MKKFGKRVLIFVGILGVLYAAYMIFMMPSGYVNKIDVVNGYIANLDNADICEKHFNEETQNHCDSITNLFEGKEVIITNTVVDGDNIILSVTVDGIAMEFEVSFVAVTVTGVKSVFNKIYYYIDFMI